MTLENLSCFDTTTTFFCLWYDYTKPPVESNKLQVLSLLWFNSRFLLPNEYNTIISWETTCFNPRLLKGMPFDFMICIVICMCFTICKVGFCPITVPHHLLCVPQGSAKKMEHLLARSWMKHVPTLKKERRVKSSYHQSQWAVTTPLKSRAKFKVRRQRNPNHLHPQG